jgi:CHAT domain-containing protein
MVAGARSILMSMWPVPLDDTSHALANFFDGWLGAGHPRYLAFHRAQQDALRHAREKRGNGHPFWWAGFVYFGDPADRVPESPNGTR